MSAADDQRYFAALRVIARLMARGNIGPYWAHNEVLPDDEALVIRDARSLMGLYRADADEAAS